MAILLPSSSIIICSSWNFRDLIFKAIFKSEHEVVEVTAKLDSYTSNKNKHLSPK